MHQLMDAYLTAREHVVARGFGGEIDWQDSQCLERISESEFLREAAWVILSAGMRETVVRSRFCRISKAFLDWRSAVEIVGCLQTCIQEALAAFRHPGKIEAIGSAATTVARMGFDAFRDRLRADGLNELQRLPFIGPVTRFHLAKNLGLDVVKPDRHLVRIANTAGYCEPQSMCQVVAEVTGDRLATVDIVLWRFATLVPDYLEWFGASQANRDHARLASQRTKSCAA